MLSRVERSVEASRFVFGVLVVLWRGGSGGVGGGGGRGDWGQVQCQLYGIVGVGVVSLPSISHRLKTRMASLDKMLRQLR